MFKTTLSIFGIGIILISSSYIGKGLIEKEVTQKLQTDKKITKYLKDFSSFKCDILPFRCNLNDIYLKNINDKIKSIKIKTASINGLTIYEIIKFSNDQKKELFGSQGKYKFKLNLNDVYINNKNLSFFNQPNIKIMNISITENIHIKENHIATDNSEITISSDNKNELLKIKTESELEAKQNKLTIKLNKVTFISNKPKLFSLIYLENMYKAYIKGLNKIKEQKQLFGLNINPKKLTKEEAFKHIKNNINIQTNLVKKYLNMYNLDINKTNTKILSDVLKGENIEKFEIEINQK